MHDDKGEGLARSARHACRRRALIVSVQTWPIWLIFLWWQGIDLGIAWGGFAVCAIISYAGWFAYHLASERNDCGALLAYAFIPLTALTREDVVDLSFLGMVLRSFWTSSLVMAFAVSFVLCCQAIAKCFRRKPRAPLWDADVDQPLAAKGPI